MSSALDNAPSLAVSWYSKKWRFLKTAKSTNRGTLSKHPSYLGELCKFQYLEHRPTSHSKSEEWNPVQTTHGCCAWTMTQTIRGRTLTVFRQRTFWRTSTHRRFKAPKKPRSPCIPFLHTGWFIRISGFPIIWDDFIVPTPKKKGDITAGCKWHTTFSNPWLGSCQQTVVQ